MTTKLALRRVHAPFWLAAGLGITAWLVARTAFAPAVDWLMANVRIA